MTHQKTVYTLGAALLAAFSCEVFAVNELFIARGPLANVTKDDVAIARTEILKTFGQ